VQEADSYLFRFTLMRHHSNDEETPYFRVVCLVSWKTATKHG